MWPPWLSSPSRTISPEPTATTPRRKDFSTCTSFKDIEALLREDSDIHHNNLRPKTKSPSIFHRVRISTSVLRALSSSSSSSSSPTTPPPPLNPKSKSEPDRPITLTQSNNDRRHVIVVYFTSLRVVRRTFDDCRTVRSILRSFRGASIDERDVSMDSTFLDELHRIFNTATTNNKDKQMLTLPRVFIGGRYIGGADEVRQLHESGELKTLIGMFPAVGSGVCEVCDGRRFVVCENCDGSHKVYIEKIGFRICGQCNLNGLIRCPNCFSR